MIMLEGAHAIELQESARTKSDTYKFYRQKSDTIQKTKILGCKVAVTSRAQVCNCVRIINPE